MNRTIQPERWIKSEKDQTTFDVLRTWNVESSFLDPQRGGWRRYFYKAKWLAEAGATHGPRVGTGLASGG